MQPDIDAFLEAMKMELPLIGVYDVPKTDSFDNIVVPEEGENICVFSFYKNWLKGQNLLLTEENYGCGGAGRCFFGVMNRSRKEFIEFLVDFEGLKASHELMEKWIDEHDIYNSEHGNIIIGSLKKEKYEYLKTIIFFVTPDQLAFMTYGAYYYNSPGEPPAIISPFGSGCMQILSLFDNLNTPQAIIGSTDVAMRKFLPENIIAFTVTKPMFKNLSLLDSKSFINKPFWKDLCEARKNKKQKS